MDGYSREDKDFNYSLNCQTFKNTSIICLLFIRDSFEYGVLKGATLSRLWGHVYERASVLGLQHPTDGEAVQTGFDFLCIVSAGVDDVVKVLFWFPKGAGPSCIAQMICLMPGTMVLVSRKAVSFAHVYETRPWVSDRLHHDSAHRVSWGAQTGIMNHSSAIQMKVSGGWVGCKSLSFYVQSFNTGIFPLFFEISPAVLHFFSYKVIPLRAQC